MLLVKKKPLPHLDELEIKFSKQLYVKWNKCVFGPVNKETIFHDGKEFIKRKIDQKRWNKGFYYFKLVSITHDAYMMSWRDKLDYIAKLCEFHCL